MKREIGAKGQVVIPKDMREYLGLRRGQKVVFEVRDQEIILKPEQDPEKFVEDFVNVPKKLEKELAIKDIKKTLEEQYEI